MNTPPNPKPLIYLQSISMENVSFFSKKTLETQLRWPFYRSIYNYLLIENIKPTAQQDISNTD